MLAVRTLLARRHLVALLCAATLLLKLLVPTGYMIDSDHGRFAIIACPGVTTMAGATADTAMAAMHGDMADHAPSQGHAPQDHAPQNHAPQDHAKVDMPCPVAGLSAAVLRATDPIQLAALVAFVLTLEWIATALPARPAPAYLRPPLRGPPAHL